MNRETFEEERAKSNRDVIQERGAELYSLLESWSTEATEACTKVHIFCVDGLKAPSAAIGLIKDTSRLLRARFIVEVYFDHLSSQIDLVGRQYLELGNEVRRIMGDHESPRPPADESPIGGMQKAFRKLVIELEQAIIQSVRECSISPSLKEPSIS